MEDILLTRRYFITGSQRFSNFFWASLIFFGGASFLVTGFLAFLNGVTPTVDVFAKEVIGGEQILQALPLRTNQRAVRGALHAPFSPSTCKAPLCTGITGASPPSGSVLSAPLALSTPPMHPLHPMHLLHPMHPMHPVGVQGVQGVQPQGARALQEEGLQSRALFNMQNSNLQGQNEDLSSELKNNQTDPSASSSIRFFPQGLIMCFYGSLGLIFGIYLWLSIFWKVGSGFNEFNKSIGVVRIFRWGLPGKNRQIDFRYKIKDIEALRVSLKEGINPRRSIALQIKGKGEIPLTRIGQPISLQDIENQASELASFLKVEIQVES